MCGIVGFINSDLSFSESENELIINRMMARIIHRGPDGNGVFLDKKMTMGSVRLSIIDINGGNQPLSNEDNSLWIVYNGEIFNYLELRTDLKKKGHQFKTQTDTEVILHLYEEYGSSVMNYLNGQFSFAIWDIKKQECFFARDRIGIRPFFYTQIKGAFIFGSEIKSLFEFPGIDRNISSKALKEVFTFWTVLTPHTVFENINELQPGHYGTFKNGRLQISEYWSLRDSFLNRDLRPPISFTDALEQLRWLLSDSLIIRLRSDVKVAAYLSGGLDSSTITSMIRKIDPGILHTFSIGFADDVYDETRYQKEVSDYLNTRHNSIVCSAKDIAESISDVIWHCEIPLLRTSPGPMMRLSNFVHQNDFKVIITGEGADEALAGYDIFKEAIIRQFWSLQPQSKIRPLLLKKLYPYVPSISSANPEILRMFFKYKLEETNSPIYSHLLRWRNTANIQKHFSNEMNDRLKDYDPVELYEEKIRSGFEKFSVLSKAQMIEIEIFLSGYLLSSQGDRVSMANSVEGRYPFLDYRLLEFTASLPDNYKLKGLNEKFLLKELMKDELPKNVIKRPKQAYRSPVMEALIGEKVPEYIREMLSSDMLRNYNIFNPESVSNLTNKINLTKQPSEMDQMAVMGILSTQLLFHLFIKEFKSLEKSVILKSPVRNKVSIEIT
jgi:asparagine synthase (glutamine-hydrolysing)